MKLNLREIIDVPGRAVSFSQEIDAEQLAFPQVRRYVEAPQAEGEVRNSAGVLAVRGTVRADMICVCDRCGAEFPSVKETEINALVTAGEDADDPAAFELEGDWLDLDEVLETAFILDMETKFLCREDCKGVCPDCGKDLNEGPCSCRKQSDPRLAVLEQLLDDKSKK